MDDGIDKKRDADKTHTLSPVNSRFKISIEQIKSLYIAEGLSAEQIAEIARQDVSKIQKIIDQDKLPELRSAYLRQGVQKIQNKQLEQASKLLDLEVGFKRLRLIQLEKQLEDFLAYYARHGHLYKTHPVTGEILMNTDGLPMLINIPSVQREILQLKDSVNLSEGTKNMLSQLDDIINTKKGEGSVSEDDDIIDMDDLDGLFTRK